MTKLPPGPWRAIREPFAAARGENPLCRVIEAADGHPLAVARDRGPLGESAEATARLMAASLTLMEAAKLAMDARAVSATEVAISKGAWGALREALAEAEGSAAS